MARLLILPLPSLTPSPKHLRRETLILPVRTELPIPKENLLLVPAIALAASFGTETPIHLRSPPSPPLPMTLSIATQFFLLVELARVRKGANFVSDSATSKHFYSRPRTVPTLYTAQQANICVRTIKTA